MTPEEQLAEDAAATVRRVMARGANAPGEWLTQDAIYHARHAKHHATTGFELLYMQTMDIDIPGNPIEELENALTRCQMALRALRALRAGQG